ncbi:MAG: peptidoglycan-binding protein [bacterium]|nr:peptidoglycan-binding protein [bacterium]
MKKIIFLSLLFFVFNSVSAQSLTITGCLELHSNMRQGTKDSASYSNVYALQSFLKVNNYMTVNPTGYFGVYTLKGVKAFQKASNITPTGFVGPLTRAAIQKASCSEVSVTPPSQNPVIPAVPTIETPVPVSPIPAPVVPVIEDPILTAPNNSSLRVRTDGTISVTNNSITVRGSVTAGARSGTMRWFELTKNPTVYKLSETTISPKISQRSNDNFEQTFVGLTEKTSYYYRACAENVDLGQISCGGTVSVTTN